MFCKECEDYYGIRGGKKRCDECRMLDAKHAYKSKDSFFPAKMYSNSELAIFSQLRQIKNGIWKIKK